MEYTSASPTGEVVTRAGTTADGVRNMGGQVAAGLVTSALSIVTAAVATRFYLGILGSEAYGVLAFALTMQGILLSLDAGIGVSVTRMVARSPGENETGALVRGLERTCWGVAVLVAAGPGLAASFLSEHWLKLGSLDPWLVAQALALGGLAMGARWPIALYQGVLTGAGKVPTLSAITAVATLANATGGVLWLRWQPDLRVLFAWFTVVGLAQAWSCRRYAMACVPLVRPIKQVSVLDFLRRTAAAAGIGVVGLMVMQVDKGVLSKMLPVADFGYYALAAMLVASVYAVVAPIFNVLFPSLARNVAGPGEISLYRNATLVLGVIVFPIAAAMAAFGGSILLLWTGDPQASRLGGPVVLWLALGTALHAITYVPYALTLAKDRAPLALAMTAAQLLLAVPLTVIGARQGGATGAASAWFAVNFASLFAGALVTHYLLLPTVHGRWLTQDVLPPLGLSLAVTFGASVLMPSTHWGPLARFVVAAGAVLACWLLAVGVSGRLRETARLLLGGRASL